VIAAALSAAVLTAAETTGEPDGLALLIPESYDILWSSVVLAVIAFAFYKFVLPKFQAVLDERTALIQGGIAKAESAQAEAAIALAAYHQQLQDARTEAARIREDARTEGSQILAEHRVVACGRRCSRDAARVEDRRRVARGLCAPVARRRPLPRRARGQQHDERR
jgi:F-type H+-transporting ATPase subunit b